MKDVYAFIQEPEKHTDRSRWVRVGLAFENGDGSLNVVLDALPISGRLIIRDREPKPEG